MDKPVAFASTEGQRYEVMNYTHLGHGYCVVSHVIRKTVVRNGTQHEANQAARRMNRMMGATR